MKRVIAVIISLFLIVGLSGCQKDVQATIQSSSSGESSVISSSSTESVSYAVSMKPSYQEENDAILTRAQLDKAVSTKYVKPKNVIIMIGDGMGLNDIELSRNFSDFKFEYGFSFEHLPNKGDATTDSFSGTTDSAASATALATGSKTINGYVGTDANKEPLKNASEIAREEGKRVGVITSDGISGATPAAFLAHSESRYNTDEIRQGYVDFAPDVLIGNGSLSDFQSSVKGSALESKLETINVADKISEFQSVLDKDPSGSKPFFGFTNFDLTSGDYRLAEVTQMALDRLENENGFFLMVENTGCDNAGHSNDVQGKVNNPAVFDKAVAVAIKYCMENPDTVLIVTSDHETGGLLLSLKPDYTLSDVRFTTTGHTNRNVGVFALGYGTECFNNKTVDNTTIGKFIIAAVKGETFK